MPGKANLCSFLSRWYHRHQRCWQSFRSEKDV